MSALVTSRRCGNHTLKRLYRMGKTERGGHTELPVRLKMSRNQLPALTRELGYTRGAEVGVWKGAYSALFCKHNPYLHMLCVDPWLSYPAWQDTKNSMEPEAQAAFMAKAKADAYELLKPLNTTLKDKFSVEAAKAERDASLDFVYIDGNHVFDAVTEDIKAWLPKVRSGGILAGHDFRHFTNKPTIHVIEAVTAYTEAHAINPWFVLTADLTPSWLWVIP